ncbi:MAG: hypothetical protein ABI651_13765 [Verrucomicrobiota bacterium]
MNTLVYENDSRGTIHRARPVRDGPESADPPTSLTSKRTGIESNRDAAPAPAHYTTTWIRWFSHDADSPDLVNFSFAFVVFMILTTGLTLIGWGITVTSAWLAVAGTFITLVGCALYGWSLEDD